MNNALRLFFWGYVFVWIQVDLVIDLLPTPIGYAFFIAGCNRLVQTYPQLKNARIVAIVGCIVTIPTIFINFEQIAAIWAYTYLLSITMIPLLFTFILLTVLQQYAEEVKKYALRDQIGKTLTAYSTVQLILLAVSSTNIYFSNETVLTIIAFMSIASIVFNIVLLTLLATIRRATPTLSHYDLTT